MFKLEEYEISFDTLLKTFTNLCKKSLLKKFRLVIYNVTYEQEPSQDQLIGLEESFSKFILN